METTLIKKIQYTLNIKFNKRNNKSDYEKKTLFLNNKWRSPLFI